MLTYYKPIWDQIEPLVTQLTVQQSGQESSSLSH
jgi:hypothetical protein